MTVQSHPSISCLQFLEIYMEIKLQYSEKISFLDPYLTPRMKIKIWTLLHIYKTYPIISWSIICLLFEMLMEFKWQGSGLYNRNCHCSTLIIFMTTGWKMKIPNPYCISPWHAQSYPTVSIGCSWNIDVLHVTNFTGK